MADTPIDEARAWAVARAEAGELVGPSTTLPSRRAVALLERERVLLPALEGAAWVLRGPDTTLDDDQVRLSVYWPLVRVLVDAYAPAALDRTSAIRAWIGEATPPGVLYLRHRQSASERSLALTPRHRIVLMPLDPAIPARVAGLPESPGAVNAGAGAGAAAPPEPAVLAGTPLPTTRPAWVLLTLPPGDLRQDMAVVGAWLQRLVVPTEDLRVVYAAVPRPVVATRLARLAEEAQNSRLAEQLRTVVADHGDAVAAPSKLGPLPRLPAAYREGTRFASPYVARFRAQMADYSEALKRARLGSPRFPPLPHREVVAVARRAKRDDVYHSTTIEGYQVTPADVEAVLSGRPVAGRTPDEVERLMALKGYAQAFDATLARLPTRREAIPVTESLILDLHTELWTPSIEAGIVRASELRTWRTRPAFLRGSRYVPPAWENVAELMRTLCDGLNADRRPPIVRAVLLHWGFETIHPFPDGNGRVGRLLMNLVLGAEGLPWVTIQAEERDEYFSALERAQVDGDILVWGRFLAARVGRAHRRAIRSAGRS